MSEVMKTMLSMNYNIGKYYHTNHISWGKINTMPMLPDNIYIDLLNNQNDIHGQCWWTWYNIILLCQIIKISLMSVEHQERGPTHLGVPYNPLDDLTSHCCLWSAFKVLCFIDHVTGKQVPLFIMKQHNLPYPLAHDKPSPFNFWTFVIKCSIRMLTYCSTPYLTLPEMQLGIVDETIFSYLRAPRSLTSKVWWLASAGTSPSIIICPKKHSGLYTAKVTMARIGPHRHAIVNTLTSIGCTAHAYNTIPTMASTNPIAAKTMHRVCILLSTYDDENGRTCSTWGCEDVIGGSRCGTKPMRWVVGLGWTGSSKWVAERCGRGRSGWRPWTGVWDGNSSAMEKARRTPDSGSFTGCLTRMVPLRGEYASWMPSAISSSREASLSLYRTKRNAAKKERTANEVINVRRQIV